MVPMSQANISLFDLITIIIAAYAAIVATVVAGWNIYVYKRDRGEVSISAGYAVADIGPGEHTKDDFFFEITITNVGKRPVYLRRHIFGLRNEGKGERGFLFRPDPDLPNRLEAGEPYSALFSRNHPDVDDQIVRISCSDTTGRVYKVSSGNIRKIRRDYREFIETGLIESKS